MKIGLRILLGYFLIVGLAAWFLMTVFVQQVKPGVSGTLEDALYDTAQMLASVIAPDVRAGRLQSSELLGRLQEAIRRRPNVSVAGLPKSTLEYRFYITDARGIVLFDSTGEAMGRDYSQWNDVYLTLRGKYGARSTRSYAHDDGSAVMYVAAPIRDGDRLVGVLSVGRPIASVDGFVERSQRNIMSWGAVVLLASLLIGIAFTVWLARAFGKVMRYVEDVQAGRKAVLPELGKTEIGTLGRALEAMRVRLEGKEYVETLMHTLTHELKSPIAAIQASAELMEEDMPPEQRARFLANIQEQNARQRQLIDRLLALVKVEKQQRLDVNDIVRTEQVLQLAAADAQSRASGRQIAITLAADAAPPIRGDALLLRQALGNLLDNAIDFAPAHSSIQLMARRDGEQLEITVRDRGPGVPLYAQDRVFERFYSLPRPDGAKSTGLGLPFVREVAALHGGTVSVVNAADGGCCALLRLPLPLRL